MARFPDMRFGVYGQEDGTSPHHYHKIAYCSPGSSGAPGVLDGCAVSCAMQVRSRATQITWSVQPQYLRTTAAAKTFEVALLGEPFNSAPPKAVVRFVDAKGVGVPSKRPTAFLWDLDNIKIICCMSRNQQQDRDTCMREYPDEQFLGKQALRRPSTPILLPPPPPPHPRPPPFALSLASLCAIRPLT